MINGKRVLIVEDNCLIGEVIAETIVEAGGCPLGPALSEREALDLIDYGKDAPDAAILDIRLDVRSFDVAARLQSLGVPFIFASGHYNELPVHLQEVPVCQKPYTVRSLLSTLGEAMSVVRKH